MQNKTIYELFCSIELIPHEKLGTLTNKVWSHLLGDVVAGTVDIGLGYITSNDEERWTEMTFSHPLIRYMSVKILSKIKKFILDSFLDVNIFNANIFFFLVVIGREITGREITKIIIYISHQRIVRLV